MRSWFLLVREIKRDISVLERLADSYMGDFGSYPRTLEGLVKEGYIRELPTTFKSEYSIDPATGGVRVTVPGMQGGAKS